jgi:hypothetical protein
LFYGRSEEESFARYSRSKIGVTLVWARELAVKKRAGRK